MDSSVNYDTKIPSEEILEEASNNKLPTHVSKIQEYMSLVIFERQNINPPTHQLVELRTYN